MVLGVLPYYIFLAVVMIVCASQQKQKSKVPLIVIFLCMVLFAGLRNQSVGTDTMSYVNSFNNLDNRSLSEDFIEILSDEPGFYLLQIFARQISGNYWVILSVVSGICYAFVLYSIKRHSENRILSLFIYITFGYYTFCFNASRQAIALSIYLLALPSLYKRNFIKYSIFVCVAALFHKTVLIAIPLYFLFIMKYSWKSLSLAAIAAIVISRRLPSLLSAAAGLEDRYLLYSVGRATGGYLLTLFYVMMSVFFILIRKRIPIAQRNEYDIFLQMLICGSIIYLIVSLSGAYVELTRFAAYFQIASIFLFAKIYNGRIKIISPIIMNAICMGCLIFFYIFLTSMAALVPYSINSNVI